MDKRGGEVVKEFVTYLWREGSSGKIGLRAHLYIPKGMCGIP